MNLPYSRRSTFVSNARIIIAEDEPIIAIDTQDSLTSLGYDVLAVVETGEEAIRKAAEIRPDLILMDIVLAGDIDGIEASKQIRETLDIPVIFITAHSTDQIIQRARDAEPYGYLVKPIGKNDLFTTIVTALNRHQLEKQLRESEEKYRTMVENINDVIFSLDNEGFITYINPVVEQISQYRTDELIGINFSELVHSDDLPGLIASFQRTITGQLEPYEFRIYDRDGSHLHVRTSSRPVKKNGEVIGLNGVLQNITAQKIAEESMEKRNREFSALNQVCQTIISSLDLDDILLKVLEEAQHLLDVFSCSIWLVDEASGELICRQTTDPQSEILRGWRLSEGQGIADWVIRHGESLIVPDAQHDERHFNGIDQKTGIVIRSILSVPLLFKNEVIGIIQVVDTEPNRFEKRDLNLMESLAASASIAIRNARLFDDLQSQIKMRKESEEALRESENRLRMVLEVTSDGVWDRNLITDHVYFSPTWIQMLGYAEDEIEPHTRTWENLIHPDDRSRVLAAMNEHLDGHTESYTSEFRMRTKDGDYKWVLSRGKVVEYDPDGRPLRILGTHMDITERKQTDEQLQRSLGEKEVLLKEIHHRVKNNFQIISSLLSLQENRVANEELARTIMDSKNRVRAMALIHERLYSSENFTSIDFSEYLHILAQELFQIYAKNPDIIMNIHAEEVMLNINQAIPCGLIVHELISNALKYAFPDEIKKGTITISLRENDFIELSVADNGIGIPEDLEPKKTNSLGFKLLYTLAESQLKGNIQLNRESGTQFRLRFQKQ
jgi:PAS domain S-box-containing protein